MSCFTNGPFSASLCLFRLFQTPTTILPINICEKCPSRAWIRTHNVQDMSILQLPLDQGSRQNRFVLQCMHVVISLTDNVGPLRSRLDRFKVNNFLSFAWHNSEEQTCDICCYGRLQSINRCIFFNENIIKNVISRSQCHKHILE